MERSSLIVDDMVSKGSHRRSLWRRWVIFSPVPSPPFNRLCKATWTSIPSFVVSSFLRMRTPGQGCGGSLMRGIRVRLTGCSRRRGLRSNVRPPKKRTWNETHSFCRVLARMTGLPGMPYCPPKSKSSSSVLTWNSRREVWCDGMKSGGVEMQNCRDPRAS